MTIFSFLQTAPRFNASRNSSTELRETLKLTTGIFPSFIDSNLSIQTLLFVSLPATWLQSHCVILMCVVHLHFFLFNHACAFMWLYCC